MNEANRKAYNKERARVFDWLSWRANSRVCMREILQMSVEGPAVVHQSKEFDTYKEDLSKPIENVDSFWNKETTRVLDVACGAGNNARDVLPFVKEVVGVDISQDMVDAFEDRVPNSRAHVIDFAAETGDQLGQFDAAYSVVAFHHIADYATVTKNVANRLKSGGRFYIIDFIKGGSSPHSQVHSGAHDAAMTEDEAQQEGVAHVHGFTVETLKSTMEKAGLSNVHALTGVRNYCWMNQEEIDSINLDQQLIDQLPAKETDGSIERVMPFDYLLVVGVKP